MLLAVSMPDCTYQGPVRMETGRVSLSLTLNGLGHARVVLGELLDGRTDDDLEAHLDSSDGWEQPVWVRPLIDLELMDAQGLDGKERIRSLEPGDYVVVCIDEESAMAQLASPLRVEG